VTVVSVVIVLGISSLAAYPLARTTAHWSRGVFLLVMLGLLLAQRVRATRASDRAADG
jgi:raffinose/stachyose/melibiose transport system permease protein